jgi:hypothetical protein
LAAFEKARPRLDDEHITGPIGRLVWQDVLSLVQFYKKQ